MDFLWVDVYRNAFAQLRMGVSQINVHQHCFSPTARNVACPFCVEEKETEINVQSTNICQTKQVPMIIEFIS